MVEKALANNSYIICSTPRTGSTLLCSLLKSTKVAGCPESYFRDVDFGKWALKWDLVKNRDEPFAPEKYLKATIKAGSTNNGVFAMRIMWGSIKDVVEMINKAYPSLNGNDYELIQQIFGRVRFVYVKRNNTVAQAVSLVKALQNNVWHISNERDDSKNASQAELYYDFEEIDRNVKEIKEHNEEWNKWFSRNNITPYEVIYEDLIDNQSETTMDILKYLEITLPEEKIQTRASNKKLSDNINSDWINRYNLDNKNS